VCVCVCVVSTSVSAVLIVSRWGIRMDVCVRMSAYGLECVYVCVGATAYVYVCMCVCACVCMSILLRTL